jgi:hypothetical protein
MLRHFLARPSDSDVTSQTTGGARRNRTDDLFNAIVEIVSFTVVHRWSYSFLVIEN